MLQLIICYCA